MKVVLGEQHRQNVKVNNFGGVLTTSSPITLKNQVIQIAALQNINDVEAVDLSNNATLIYNSATQIYEIKPMTYELISGDIDCGTF